MENNMNDAEKGPESATEGPQVGTQTTPSHTNIGDYYVTPFGIVRIGEWVRYKFEFLVKNRLTCAPIL